MDSINIHKDYGDLRNLDEARVQHEITVTLKGNIVSSRNQVPENATIVASTEYWFGYVSSSPKVKRAHLAEAPPALRAAAA